jgi:hypothetical protein
VTSGSDAGQITLGYGMFLGFLTGSLYVLVVPPSPLDANTEMLLAWASANV